MESEDWKIKPEEILLLVHKHFLPVFDRKLAAGKKYVQNVHKVQLHFVTYLLNQQESQEQDFMQAQVNKKVYKLELSKLLKKNLVNHDEKNFDEQFPSFVKSLDVLIDSQKEIISLEQNDSRFIISKEDKLFTRIAKSAKKLGMSATQIFRGKDHQWHHDVRLRNISRFYWKEHLSQKLITLLNPIYRSSNTATELMWQADKKIDAAIHSSSTGIQIKNGQELIADLKNCYSKAIQILDDESESIKKKSEIIIRNMQAEYESIIAKAGTFELSNKDFDTESLKRKHTILNKSVQRLDKEWGNTTEVLCDDWYLELEIQLLINIASVSYNKTIKHLDKKILSTIHPQLDQISSYYVQVRNNMQQAGNTSQLKSIVKDMISNNQLSNYSRKTLKVDDALLYEELPIQINGLESHLEKSIKIISKETSVCDNEDYLRPIKDDEITYSSIQEILRYECWPEYQKRSKEIKSNITENVLDIQNHFSNLAQIEAFNLITAKEFLEEEKTTKPVTLEFISSVAETDEQQGELVIQGMDRLIENIALIKTKLDTLFERTKSELAVAIEGFQQKVNELSEDENMLAIKVKIAANTALEKSKKVKEQFNDKLKNFFPLLVQRTKEKYNQGALFLQNLQKKIGFQDDKDTMDLKLTEFLTSAEKSIETLPFIYKRLFRDIPLKGETYFIGRAQELESLKTALSRFNNGQYSSTIILGEKGAGITSLMNQFCKTIEGYNPVLRKEIMDSYHTTEDFYKLISSIFGTEINNLQEGVDHTSKLQKTVVVLENVHLLYLKKIDGFEVLKQLSELISLTSEHVLWVLSCYQYSFNFLDSTISFSENFRYEIQMEEFSNETMINIIKERHSVSGYSVKFLPSFDNLKSKKFDKLSKKEKQDFLENQYFTKLNKLTKGNIRMALLYWLSSTKESNNNSLFINPMHNFDLSYLRNLPEDSLYILGALIQHDKLKLHALAKVMNMGHAALRRTLQTMNEYGLVVQRDEYSLVNPLLYRQCITILQSKNIIH